MTIRNLEGAVRPKSVAVIGASPREGSVGRIVPRSRWLPLDEDWWNDIESCSIC